MDKPHILWVDRSYTRPRAGVRPHTHPFIHLLCVYEGTADFIAGGDSFPLHTGEMILISKDVQHSYSNSSQDEVLYYGEVKFVPDPTTLNLLKGCPYLRLEQPLAFQLFSRIIEEYAPEGHQSDTAVEAFLAALLQLFTEPLREPLQRDQHALDISGFSPLSVRITEYLEAHFTENVQLEDIGQELGYNSDYLCRAFHKDTGITVLDALNRIRIRRAAKLLAYSDQSVAEVALLCGFGSSTQFGRVFQKYIGLTPSQCRRAYPADVLYETEKASLAELESLRERGFHKNVLSGTERTLSSLFSE